MEEDSSLQELKGIPHGGCSPALVALAHPPLWDLLVLSSQGQYRALQAWLVLAFFFSGGHCRPVGEAALFPGHRGLLSWPGFFHLDPACPT